MEIGVADGENARKMVLAATENFPIKEVEYFGFDTFQWNDDYAGTTRKLEDTGCHFQLFQGDSVETPPTIVKQLPLMDVIFIDGGHSYPTVKSDWDNSKLLMHDETAVFFHNYGFSGPHKVVDQISRRDYYVKIIDSPSDALTALVKKK